MADGVFFWSKLLTIRNIQYEYYGVSLDYFDLITFVNLQSHLLVDLKEKILCTICDYYNTIYKKE